MASSSTQTVTIPNRLGMHARPATLFAETAGRFGSDVTVRRNDGGDPVDGKSIMQLMMLAATEGTALVIDAKGDDADDAVASLVGLVQGGFDE
ncbi:MAG: HPr family phosphocarrier protein [Phycisphaerales bacterium]|nr:HPr family phosphocarrier protein [Phycisphaerales bacterium]